jgi:hypothetical protein
MIKGTTRVKATLKGTGETVWYHYAYRGGPRFWIGGKDDNDKTPAYLAAYKAVMEPELPPLPPTVSELAAEWQGSIEWEKLAPRTRKDYDRGLNDFLDEFGADDAARLMNETSLRGLVRAWIERNPWRGKEADKRLDAAKAFARWLTIKDLATYPGSQLLGMPKYYNYKPRAEFVWTAKQFETFCEGARPELVRAAKLLRGVGCRIGDAVWLGPDHAKPRTKKGGWAIIWTPGKTANSTGAAANVVATPDVEEIIRTTPEGRATFLVNSFGRPWKPETLGKEIKLAAVALGLPTKLTTNALRGTSATETAWKEGISVKEMALRFGWTEPTAAKMMALFTSRNPDTLEG